MRGRKKGKKEMEEERGKWGEREKPWHFLLKDLNSAIVGILEERGGGERGKRGRKERRERGRE